MRPIPKILCGKRLAQWTIPVLIVTCGFFLPGRSAELIETKACFRVSSGGPMEPIKLEGGTKFSIAPQQVEVYESLDVREKRVLIEVSTRSFSYAVPAGSLTVGEASLLNSPCMPLLVMAAGVVLGIVLSGRHRYRQTLFATAMLLLFVGYRFCSSYVVVEASKLKAGMRLTYGFAYATPGMYSYTTKNGFSWPTHKISRKSYPPDYGPRVESAEDGVWYSISTLELYRLKELREENRHRPVLVTDPASGFDYLAGSMDIVPSPLNAVFLVARWGLWLVAFRLFWAVVAMRKSPEPIAVE